VSVFNSKLSTIIESLEDSAQKQTSEISELQENLSYADAHTAVLKASVKKFCMQTSRSADSKAKAVIKAVSEAQISAQSYNLKSKGVVADDAQSMACNLIRLGLPMTKVNDAVHVVGETLGVTVKGDMST
jgi:hypothetical protein